jgi:transposase
MDKLQKTRLDWIKLYQEVKDAGIVCSRCGISRPTLRKWLKRYAEEGIKGLKELSRKPHSSPKKSIRSTRKTFVIYT